MWGLRFRGIGVQSLNVLQRPSEVGWSESQDLLKAQSPLLGDLRARQPV